MFFFFVGGVYPRIKTLQHAAGRQLTCPCDLRAPASLKRTDYYLYLFFIPVMRLRKGSPEKDEFLQCDHCGWITAATSSPPTPEEYEEIMERRRMVENVSSMQQQQQQQSAWWQRLRSSMANWFQKQSPNLWQQQRQHPHRLPLPSITDHADQKRNCTQCGSPLQPHFIYCPHCGTRVH